ncbi:hypothetical protein E4U53_001158 [Claviceps sorghi]|nr:hypothetical protein E4U53_001158 [Claviceps sorghi]
MAGLPSWERGNAGLRRRREPRVVAGGLATWMSWTPLDVLAEPMSGQPARQARTVRSCLGLGSLGVALSFAAISAAKP